MADSLVFNPQTAATLNRYVATPSHALLIVGADGIGKGSAAQHIASRILSIDPARMLDSPACRLLQPDEKHTISIEAIRNLQRFVRLKTTGQGTIRRAIIIEHAGSMTIEAQNAFLKILEEPPADTIIIVTAEAAHDVLPTIRSRVQQLHILSPSKELLVRHFAGYPEAAVMQAYFLSGGLPGLMSALLDKQTDHPLLTSVTAAKKALQQDTFERLAHIDQLTKQKPDALRFCQALERIAQAGLDHAAAKDDGTALRQWLRILRAAHQSKDMLSTNVNTKLTLTHLMLQL